MHENLKSILGDDFHDNPFILFDQWLKQAEQSEINDPNAMALASIDADGTPGVRMVLCKHYDETGFVFYTNFNSRKGQALQANPKAEVCFHWKSLEKQIRITGNIEKVTSLEADEYYNSRHRGSRIGAWASKQSQPMEQFADLEALVDEYDKKMDQDNPPRPEHWGGFRIIPTRIEFWLNGDYRLHKRFAFTKNNDGIWQAGWVYP